MYSITVNRSEINVNKTIIKGNFEAQHKPTFHPDLVNMINDLITHDRKKGLNGVHNVFYLQNTTFNT